MSQEHSTQTNPSGVLPPFDPPLFSLSQVSPSSASPDYGIFSSAHDGAPGSITPFGHWTRTLPTEPRDAEYVNGLVVSVRQLNRACARLTTGSQESGLIDASITFDHLTRAWATQAETMIKVLGMMEGLCARYFSVFHIEAVSTAAKEWLWAMYGNELLMALALCLLLVRLKRLKRGSSHADPMEDIPTELAVFLAQAQFYGVTQRETLAARLKTFKADCVTQGKTFVDRWFLFSHQ
jgi:hypothetical protein